MTLNERKALNTKLQNGGRITFQDAMNAFFLPEDQDAFARSHGWEDMAQMAHYEDQQEVPRMSNEEWNTFIDEVVQKNRDEEVPPMTDSEVEALVERESSTAIVDGTVEYLAPPPSEILVLARQDSREVYGEDEACPLRAWYDTGDELAGVY